MNEISKTLLSNIYAENDALSQRFIGMIQHLYQFKIFKEMLDLTLTLIQENRLQFVVQDKRIYDIDEGTCKTIFASKMNNVLNTFRTNNNYKITIKKLDHDVIIHEIAHMMEYETQLNIRGFVQAIEQDLTYSSPIVVNEAIQFHIRTPLQHYPENSRNSELFARFYHLHALTKEVVGKFRKTGYDIHMLEQAFPNCYKYFKHGLVPKGLIDENISSYTAEYLVTDAVRHNWSNNYIGRFHKTQNKGKWKSAIKSIKDNPFDK